MRAISVVLTFLSIHLLPLLALAEDGHDHGAEDAAAEPSAGAMVDAWLEYLWRPKFVTMLVLGLLVLALLKTKLLNKPIKVALLLVSTFAFGLAANLPGDFFGGFAMHPSPMCAFTKPLLYGMRKPFVVTMGVIVLLTAIGPKLFCGWVCPVGAVQELMAMLGEKLKLRVKALPFRLTNTVRVAIALVFIGVTVTGLTGWSIYSYLNPFHGFEIGKPESFGGFLAAYLPFLLTLGLALKVYRPFCFLVCPVGLATHLFEQVGLVRVTHDEDRCNDCAQCRTDAVCPTVPDVLQAAELRPDCFACNRCVAACPSGALVYGLARRKGKRYQKVS